MTEFVFLNEQLIPRDEAKISVDDSGFLYGFGCYDTLLALEYTPLFVEEHVNRLNRSIQELKIDKAGFEPTDINNKIKELLSKNSCKNARIRITVTKGVVDLQNIHIVNPNMTLLITSTPLADDYYNRNIQPFRLFISKYIRNHPHSIPSSLKLTSLANHIFASMEAKENGYDDGIMLSYNDYLTEGSSFNIFMVKKNTIYTPHLETGILPGITRNVLLNIFKMKGYSYEEGYYHKESLYSADEAFATSSVRGIVPIKEVDNHRLMLGDYTKQMTHDYYNYLKEILED